jgi:hypothetical protein
MFEAHGPDSRKFLRRFFQKATFFLIQTIAEIRSLSANIPELSAERKFVGGYRGFQIVQPGVQPAEAGFQLRYAAAGGSGGGD